MIGNILVLCTGNATRSVIAGAVLKAHLPDVEIITAGTMSIDGLPMSWRTRAGFESVGVTPPAHRSRQVEPDDLDGATVVIGLAPEHVQWVRREHPAAAARTVTLKRLARELAADARPLSERVADLHLADVELAPWEEVVDPGGGEVEAFIACAQEVVGLVEDLAERLRPREPAADDWTGERAARWVAIAASIERQLAPVSDVLFAAAGLRPGERVLDVGCGAGPTTRQAASAVGPSGAVVGIDIAQAMLDAAAAEAAPPGAAAIEWLRADVATWEPDRRPFDAVISRFGVMFFSDPGAAFTNLRRATAPGGRLCVAVWAPRGECPLFEVPLEAALAVLGPGNHPDVPAPDAGAYSFGDPDAVRALLSSAGWTDIAWQPHRLQFRLGGGVVPEDAAETAMTVGPTRIVTEGLDEDRRGAVREEIARALGEHVDEHGHVVLDGTVGIVTAVLP